MVRKAKASTLKNMSARQLVSRGYKLKDELTKVNRKIEATQRRKTPTCAKDLKALRKRKTTIQTEMFKTRGARAKKLSGIKIQRDKDHPAMYQVVQRGRVILDGIPTRDEAEAWRDDFKSGREEIHRRKR